MTYAGIKCLFKPLDIDELQSAIDETKAKPGFAHLAYEMANGIIKSQFTRIPVATKEGLSFLPVSSILFVLAKDGKSEIYFENNHKMKSDRSLEEFSLLITSENFIQLGRDIIINKPQIISELTQPECLFFKDGSKLESDKKIVNELLRNLL